MTSKLSARASRRDFLKSLGTASLALNAAGASAAPNDYNVLVLMSDEHSPSVAGYAGDPFISTFALDALALSGVQFTAAYSPDPMCVPARQAFHSGRMGSNLDFEVPNYEALGPYFSRMGFATAWFGKQHWKALNNSFADLGVSSRRVADERFAEQGLPLPVESRLVADATIAYWGTDLNEDTVTTEQVLGFLDGIGNKRFFLGASFVKPHFPFCIQERFYKRYETQPIPEPVVTPTMLADLSTAMKSDRIQYGIDQLTPEQSRFCRAIYYGMVQYMDSQVHQVMTRLRELDLRRKTIVVYLADHGEMMGQHGTWYKNNFFEGSARVPLLISLPHAFKVASGSTVKTPVSLIDIFPTLCELCALPPPPTLEGSSLLPLMDGRDTGSTRAAFAENSRRGIPARMIRTANHKYCYYDDGFEQMYAMQGKDWEAEDVNLAPDPAYAAIKARLKARALANWKPAGLALADDADEP